MILSMTGFGRGEASGDGFAATVEMRSVNNRFLEVSARMPREFAAREHDLREIIRQTLSRGKVNVNVNVERSADAAKAPVLDEALAGEYKEALNQLRKVAKIKETVSLEHLLFFKDEIFRQSRSDDFSEEEWKVVAEAAKQAVNDLHTMRKNEGRELARDLRRRISDIDRGIEKIEKLSADRVPKERERLRDRIARLFENEEIDEQRLELEIVILADKLDVTEECVRYRSHSKFFIDVINGPEAAGRKLNFLLQEMLREINTIGSKSNDTEIAHIVVEAKEELERIREQVQNIE